MKYNINIIRKCMFVVIMALLFTMTACGSKGKKEYSQAVDFFENGAYSDAKDLMKQAVSLEPDNAQYCIGYGLSLIGMAEYDQAREQFLAIIKDSKSKSAKETNKQAYRGIALSYYESGVYDQAKAYFKLALDVKVLDNMDNDLMAYYANCDMFMNNYEAAVKSFSTLIDNTKKSDDSVKADYYIGRGNAYYVLENYNSALEDYNNAIDNSKDCYAAYLGKYLTLTGTHDKKSAQETLDKALQIDDNSDEADYYKAIFQFYKGDYKASRVLLDLCISNGNNEALYYIGRIYQEQGDYNEALNNYNAYLEKYPNRKNSEVCNQAAGCYIALEDYDNAAKWLDDGLVLAGGSIKENLLYNRIAVYEKTGNYKQAKELADEYLESYKNDDMTREYEFIRTRYRDDDKKKEAE